MLRVTKTENGTVKGFPGTDARITVFKGIPFAAPPVGDLRWKAPQPAKNWDGVRECYEFGNITMQRTPGLDPNAFYSKEWHVDPEIKMGEDGLFVNVWTPAKSTDEKLPVMVWIFGGGLQEGYAHEMEFDGERIASRGVILVTVAYRLNVFGYLAHPDLTAESPEAPSNFGFLDQKAALEWVQRNIANFGGDPGNVTLFGQSSGGVSVFSHLCSEQSKGLFHKAIIMSSAGGSVLPVYPKGGFGAVRDLAASEEIGKKFVKDVLGCDTIEEARKLDAFEIRDKVVEAGARFGELVDGKFSTKTINQHLFDNTMNDAPVMLGYTVDEFHTRAKGDTVDEIKAYAEANYGPYADDMFALWKKVAGSDDPEAIKDASDINLNEMSARWAADEFAAQGRKAFVWAFDPTMPGDDAGSFHSSDLWFAFETLMKCWRPFDGHHYDLARRMCNYWTNFAKTGDPNGNDADGTPMPKWEQYTADNRRVINLFDEIEMEKDGAPAVMDAVIDINRKEARK